MYTKFNNKNLNTKFDFINGLVTVTGNNVESETIKYSTDTNRIQIGSSSNDNNIDNSKNRKQKRTNPIKDDVYDELFKQATIYTGIKSRNRDDALKNRNNITGMNTKKRTKLKNQHNNTSTNTKKKNKKNI